MARPKDMLALRPASVALAAPSAAQRVAMELTIDVASATLGTSTMYILYIYCTSCVLAHPVKLPNLESLTVLDLRVQSLWVKPPAGWRQLHMCRSFSSTKIRLLVSRQIRICIMFIQPDVAAVAPPWAKSAHNSSGQDMIALQSCIAGTLWMRSCSSALNSPI